jgi:outer membrane protein TolC
MEKQKKRLELREKQVQQTVGKLRLSQSKFEHGMTDNFVLIEAQTELQEAQNNNLLERINYINGVYRLRAALGTLLERSNEAEEE